MFNVGGGEFLAILVVALIVLGPDKLPDAARKAGKLVADIRRMSGGFQSEMRNALNTDELKELRDLRDTIQGKNVFSGGRGPSLPPLESEVRATNTALAGAVPGSSPVADPVTDPVAGSSPVADLVTHPGSVDGPPTTAPPSGATVTGGPSALPSTTTSSGEADRAPVPLPSPAASVSAPGSSTAEPPAA